MIYYIAVIENGQIKTLKLPNGDNESEGTRDDGTTIVHIDFPIEDRFVFINTHFWEDGWKQREPSPNRHAVWTNGEWVWNHEDLLKDVRLMRNKLLSVCDWTQVSDSPLSADMKNAWATYRQELRDITNNLDDITNLENVPWPTKPE